jgi:hypothetical protein
VQVVPFTENVVGLALLLLYVPVKPIVTVPEGGVEDKAQATACPATARRGHVQQRVRWLRK